MTDLLTALAERLRNVPMRCANCGKPTPVAERIECPEGRMHSWEVDDEATAREALAFAREQLPTTDEIKGIVVHKLASSHQPLFWDKIGEILVCDLKARLT